MENTKAVFKIIEEKEDPLESVIERTAVQTSTFTLYELKTNRKAHEKLVRELSAQVEVASAKVANIEEHYPFTKELTPEQSFAAHMREENLALIRSCKPKLEEIKVSMAELDEDENEVKEQIGVAIPVADLGPTAPVDLSAPSDEHNS